MSTDLNKLAKTTALEAVDANAAAAKAAADAAKATADAATATANTAKTTADTAKSQVTALTNRALTVTPKNVIDTLGGHFDDINIDSGSPTYNNVAILRGRGPAGWAVGETHIWKDNSTHVGRILTTADGDLAALRSGLDAVTPGAQKMGTDASSSSWDQGAVYVRRASGLVHLSIDGLSRGSAIPTDKFSAVKLCATLPAEYRPDRTLVFRAMGWERPGIDYIGDVLIKIDDGGFASVYALTANIFTLRTVEVTYAAKVKNL